MDVRMDAGMDVRMDVGMDVWMWGRHRSAVRFVLVLPDGGTELPLSSPRSKAR